MQKQLPDGLNPFAVRDLLVTADDPNIRRPGQTKSKSRTHNHGVMDLQFFGTDIENGHVNRINPHIAATRNPLFDLGHGNRKILSFLEISNLEKDNDRDDDIDAVTAKQNFSGFRSQPLIIAQEPYEGMSIKDDSHDFADLGRHFAATISSRERLIFPFQTPQRSAKRRTFPEETGLPFKRVRASLMTVSSDSIPSTSMERVSRSTTVQISHLNQGWSSPLTQRN